MPVELVRRKPARSPCHESLSPSVALKTAGSSTTHTRDATRRHSRRRHHIGAVLTILAEIELDFRDRFVGTDNFERHSRRIAASATRTPKTAIARTLQIISYRPAPMRFLALALVVACSAPAPAPVHAPTAQPVVSAKPAVAPMTQNTAPTLRLPKTFVEKSVAATLGDRPCEGWLFRLHRAHWRSDGDRTRHLAAWQRLDDHERDREWRADHGDRAWRRPARAPRHVHARPARARARLHRHVRDDRDSRRLQANEQRRELRAHAVRSDLRAQDVSVHRRARREGPVEAHARRAGRQHRGLEHRRRERVGAPRRSQALRVSDRRSRCRATSSPSASVRSTSSTVARRRAACLFASSR